MMTPRTPAPSLRRLTRVTEGTNQGATPEREADQLPGTKLLLIATSLILVGCVSYYLGYRAGTASQMQQHASCEAVRAVNDKLYTAAIATNKGSPEQRFHTGIWVHAILNRPDCYSAEVIAAAQTWVDQIGSGQ